MLSSWVLVFAISSGRFGIELKYAYAYSSLRECVAAKPKSTGWTDSNRYYCVPIIKE